MVENDRFVKFSYLEFMSQAGQNLHHWVGINTIKSNFINKVEFTNQSRLHDLVIIGIIRITN
jgi:hypothetical protein